MVKKKLNSDRAPIAFTGEPINNFEKLGIKTH